MVRAEDYLEIAATSDAAVKPDVSTGLPTFSTEALFGRATEIGLSHQGILYRLRITRQGKLILNK